MIKINRLIFFFFNLGLFSFLFLWDIKFGNLQLRFLLILSSFYLLSNFENYNFKKLKKTFFIPTLILFHFIIFSFLNNYTLETRDLFGLAFLFIVFFVVISNFQYLEKSLKNMIDIFIILFSLFFLLYFWYSNSFVTLDCYNGWFHKHKFVFIENSHFAIMSVPIINYYIFKFFHDYKYKKYDYIIIIFFIIFFIISFLNFSTTFLIGLILTQFYILIKFINKKKIIISSTILIILSFFILLNYKQCSVRSIDSIDQVFKLYSLKIDNQNSSLKEQKKILLNQKIQINMSIETLLVSLEITYRSLKDNLFGVGFNKYHFAHKKYIDQIVKIDNSVRKNNIYDGSSNLSKIITEFGIFGIFVILFFIFSLLRKKNFTDFDIFLISLISIQFIRGVGYFNGGLVMILLIYFYKLYTEKLKLKKN